MNLIFDYNSNQFVVKVKKKSNIFYQLIKKKSFNLLKETKGYITAIIDYDDLEFEFIKI